MSHQEPSNQPSSQSSSQSSETGETHTAGAFDIRSIIAALIGGYGVVLVVMGLVSTSDSDLDRSGGMNINLLAGIGMIVFAAVFLLWVRLRPLVVSTRTPEDGGTRH